METRPINYHNLTEDSAGMKYILLEPYTYYSKRYDKNIDLERFMKSDGATGFIDIGADRFTARIFNWLREKIHGAFARVKSAWFFVHDKICNTGRWSDGTKITNWQASMVAFDILRADGWVILAAPVHFFTFLFGGGEAKKNGMFRL